MEKITLNLSNSPIGPEEVTKLVEHSAQVMFGAIAWQYAQRIETKDGKPVTRAQVLASDKEETYVLTSYKGNHSDLGEWSGADLRETARTIQDTQRDTEGLQKALGDGWSVTRVNDIIHVTYADGPKGTDITIDAHQFEDRGEIIEKTAALDEGKQVAFIGTDALDTWKMSMDAQEFTRLISEKVLVRE